MLHRLHNFESMSMSSTDSSNVRAASIISLMTKRRRIANRWEIWLVVRVISVQLRHLIEAWKHLRSLAASSVLRFPDSPSPPLYQYPVITSSRFKIN